MNSEDYSLSKSRRRFLKVASGTGASIGIGAILGTLTPTALNLRSEGNSRNVLVADLPKDAILTLDFP